MTPAMISRRLFMLAGVALPFAATAVAQQATTGDHGIGGSGLAVTGGEGDEDHGIGGTGIVGTIQGFGSIIVNGVHIPFGVTTPVYIDGKRVSANAMHVGHVVRVLLSGRRAKTISIVSEVQGRIDRIGKRDMTVLSQTIDTTGVDTKGLRKGGRVAVFGIRKPDGTIVARRIERRLVADGAHLRGVPQKRGRRMAIGGLVLEGANRYLLGKQTIVRFTSNGRHHLVASVEAEAVVPGLRHGVINVETYGSGDKGMIALGVGISTRGDRMQFSSDGHGFVDVSVRDSSRMGSFGNGGGPGRVGPPGPGGAPQDRSSFARDRSDPGRKPRGGPGGPPGGDGPPGGTPGGPPGGGPGGPGGPAGPSGSGPQ
jgi:hypothetical protein